MEGAGRRTSSPRSGRGAPYHTLELAAHAEHLEAGLASQRSNPCVLKRRRRRRCRRRSWRTPRTPDVAGLPGVFNLLQGALAPDRRRAGGGSPALAHFLHGFDRDGQDHRSDRHGQPRAPQPGARRQVALHRARGRGSRSAARTARFMYRNAAQVCLAGTRLLVYAAVRDAFVERMRACVEGSSAIPARRQTEVGPLIRASTHAKLTSRRRARERRARALGREGHDFGDLYYAPTLLTDVHRTTRSCRRVFGPILVLGDRRRRRSRRAGDTRYGLGGLCFGETAHAQRVPSGCGPDSSG